VFGPGRFAERGRAGRGDDSRARADGARIEARLVSVFLTPPSIAVLETRLKNRAADSAAEIQKRLTVARQEIAQWNHFDFLLISASVPEICGGCWRLSRRKNAGGADGSAGFLIRPNHNRNRNRILSCSTTKNCGCIRKPWHSLRG